VDIDHASTVLATGTTRRPGGVPRQVIQFLVKGPAEKRSAVARWGINLLAVAGAVFLVWSSVIHLQLWSDGYDDISVIGPLFLAQGIAGIVIALAVVAFRRLVLLAAGAVTLAATAVGLLLSVHTGLFGYRESLAVPYAESSLVIEFTGTAVLAIAAVAVLVAPSRPRANL
jgi:hypothetical protein